MQSRAVDAVDSALQLLRDLKQANVDAQAKADEINVTQEAELARQIADLTTIADQNKQVGDDSTAHRKHIEAEIQSTQEYLVWNNNRKAEIVRKRDEYREQRCIANLMFIKSLKEHDEALEVVRWLKEDVLGVVQAHQAGEDVSFADISTMDSAMKLTAYAHLFNQKALAEFAQLTQGPQAVDASTAEWDDDANDNTRGELSLQHMGSGADQRDVGQKLLDAIDALEQHLITAMADLEKNEIKAAWDLAQWI